MQINLTRNQLRILLANDPNFIEHILDILEGANPVDIKAQELSKTCDNKIEAIKELRAWAALPENLYDVKRGGYETHDGVLGLASAKAIIEKYMQ